MGCKAVKLSGARNKLFFVPSNMQLKASDDEEEVTGQNSSRFSQEIVFISIK
jgi:hypothetical protein